MKKTITLMLLLSITGVIELKAQDSGLKKIRLGIGIEGALAGKGLKDSYSAGAGLTFRAQYNINREVGITLTSGVIAFIPKDLSGSSKEAKAVIDIPVKLGGKYMITDYFYGMLELGISSIGVYYSDANGDIQKAPSSSSFTYAPGIGVKLGGVTSGYVMRFLSMRIFLARVLALIFKYSDGFSSRIIPA